MSRKKLSHLLDQAADLYERFTGLPAETVEKIEVENVRAGVLIGEVEEIAYNTVRKHGDDEQAKKHRYRHRFKASARPVLAASHDGKVLMILLGEFEFTEKGITDK